MTLKSNLADFIEKLCYKYYYINSPGTPVEGK